MKVSYEEKKDEKHSALINPPESDLAYLNSSHSQRTFSFDEYCRIIDYAELLRELDKRKESPKAKSRLEELSSDSVKVNKVLESRVYEFAGEMGIPE